MAPQESVIKHLVEVTGQPDIRLGDNLFTRLGLDSLSWYELCCTLEDELSVDLSQVVNSAGESNYRHATVEWLIRSIEAKQRG